MPALRNYHIFISHSWDYNEQYETVREWLDDANNFSSCNYSVPLSNPIDVKTKTELKEKIRAKISPCSCIIVLSGMYVDYSEWIDFEMDVAREYGKPIIGVKPWGQQRVPIRVQDMADVMVGWNSSSVVHAVREYAL